MANSESSELGWWHAFELLSKHRFNRRVRVSGRMTTMKNRLMVMDGGDGWW